jgi:class 3 adenylate cyclase
MNANQRGVPQPGRTIHDGGKRSESAMPKYPSGTVAFLFTGIEGSTKRWERDTPSMRVAVERHFTLLGEAISAQNGVLFKTIGDVARPWAASYGSIQDDPLGECCFSQ